LDEDLAGAFAHGDFEVEFLFGGGRGSDGVDDAGLDLGRAFLLGQRAFRFGHGNEGLAGGAIQLGTGCRAVHLEFLITVGAVEYDIHTPAPRPCYRVSD